MLTELIDRAVGLLPEKVRSTGYLRPRYPLVGIELREDAAIAVRLARRGTRYHVAGHAQRNLAPGVFSATLLRSELGDAAALLRAVQDALQMAGAASATRISLAVPDTMARVLVVDLEELPRSAAQAAEVIRFRIKKSVPFRPEEARLSWQPLGRSEDGRVQVLVAVAPDAVIAPLESLLGSVGLRVGLVGLSSFDVFNALRLVDYAGGASGDVGLLNATPTYFSLMIHRGERLILYRSKGYHVQGGFQGEESLRVVGRELRSTLGYYEEHLLGEGIGAMHVRVAGIDARGVLEVVAASTTAPVREASLQALLPETGALPEGVAAELMPALGLALRRVA